MGRHGFNIEFMPSKPSDGTSKHAVNTRRIGRTNPKMDDGTLTSRLFERRMVRIDLDELTSALADKRRKQLVDSLNVERTVTTRFDMHGEELQQGLVYAIVQRL